jgi:hypothetical protein
MIKIKEFFIEKSKVNTHLFILVAIDEHGNKYVCSGDSDNPTYLVKYDESFDTKPLS